MPRTFVRHERSVSAERKFRVYAPRWVDPYWWIDGSSIEKMVMAELARRGVYFIYRAQTNDLGGFVDPKWEADFLLPQHKIWVEVQGSYFHSLPGAIENDSLRYAAIEMAGWKPLFLWEFDIRTRLPEVLDQVPELYQVRLDVEAAARKAGGRAPGVEFGLGAPDLVDQLVGLRKALAGRRKPPQFVSRRRPRRRPK
jgi:very-short-patch-repair endonuclease